MVGIHATEDFPKRKIAKLKQGFEASFIAMPENPLNDFEAVKNINYRFKQGVPISTANDSEQVGTTPSSK